MALERPNLETIYNRMKADAETRVTDQVKIPRASLMGVLLAVFAGAVHLLYGFLDFLSRQLLPDTATGSWLTRWGGILGLPIKAATYASGQVTFTGTPGAVIPASTVLQDQAGTEFSTVQELILGPGGTGTVPVAANDAGEIGNTTDMVLQLSGPLPGVDTEAVVASPGMTGGVDEEAPEDLRQRILQRLQNPPASGNRADYIRWATEVEGVGKAWCLSADEFLGAGTVGVIVATEENTPVDAATLTETTAYIEEQRPLGAEVQVLNMIAASVGFSIQIKPNTTAVQDAIRENLQSMFIQEGTPGGTVLLSHVQGAIAVSGAADFKITAMSYNGAAVPAQDLELQDLEVPQVGTLIFSLKG